MRPRGSSGEDNEECTVARIPCAYTPAHRAAPPEEPPRPATGGMEEDVRALLSVANRDGIADLAHDLTSLDVEMFATDRDG